MDADTAASLWRKTLSELEFQMTKATFTTWLKDTRLLRVDNGRLVIGVKNDYAKDWLENRLIDSILRTIRVIADDGKLVVAFELVPAEGKRPYAPPSSERARVHSPLWQVSFPGFENFHSNFVQVPRQFFEVVLSDGPVVMRVFVGHVIAETYGVIVNLRTKARREWWEASRREIMRVTGIRSAASVDRAIFESRARGYVIREQGFSSFKYRPREEGDPVDKPVDN